MRSRFSKGQKFQLQREGFNFVPFLCNTNDRPVGSVAWHCPILKYLSRKVPNSGTPILPNLLSLMIQWVICKSFKIIPIIPTLI